MAKRKGWLARCVPELVAILETVPPTNAEFCGQIIVADGKQRGMPLSVAGHPAQEALIQAYDSRKYKSIALAKPVQDGGTLVSLVPMLRRAVALAQTVVLAYPTGQSGGDIWSTKIKPVLDRFGGQEPEKGGGSRGGAARVVKLPGGGCFILRSAGGRGESGQASVTGDVVFCDEVDDWPSLHRLELMALRISESRDPLAIFCSTVKRDGETGDDDGSLILALVDAGTNSRLTFPCPHCAHRQTLEWERVDTESARIACEDCGVLWTEAERRAALKDWQLKSETEDTDAFSLRYSSLDSPRKSLSEIVSIYQRAEAALNKGDHGPMRSFYRDRLSRRYTGDRIESDGQERLTLELMQQRSHISPMETAIHQTDIDRDSNERGLYSRHIAPWPTEQCFGILAADVQGNRIYWTITAHYPDGTTRLNAWGYEYGNQENAPWTSEGEFVETASRLHGIADHLCGPGGWVVGGMDCGDGNLAEWIVSFVLRSQKWHALDGKGDRVSTDRAHPMDVLGIAYLRVPEGRPGQPATFSAAKPLIHVASNAVRERVHAALLIPVASPGALVIPPGLDARSAICKHLLGQKQETGPTGNKRWIDTPNTRHDWLDCVVYGWALGQVFAPSRIQQRQQQMQHRRANNPMAYLQQAMQRRR